MTKKQHNPYFDFLKGIAILMVVGIHTYPGGHSLGNGLSDTIQLVLINFFNCAVPLFLAISGYFIGKRKLYSASECKSFWKKQIPTVYIPALLFSLPWFVTYCITVDYNLGGVIINTAKLFLCGHSVYYFVALIIECYLLAPLLVRHNNIKTLILVITISVITTIGIEYLRFHHGIELPLIIRGSFPVLLIFFYLGIFLSKHNRNYSLALPIILMTIGLCLGLIHMEYIRDTYQISGQGQKLTLYLFDVGVILLCMSKQCELAYRNNPINRIILYIGEISFGIYFTHIYMINIAARFIPTIQESWITLWLFSITLTIVFIAILKKTSPEYSRKYLGYR